MTRAQEAEENYLVKRELATVKQQGEEASAQLEQAQSIIRQLQQQQQQQQQPVVRTVHRQRPLLDGGTASEPPARRKTGSTVLERHVEVILNVLWCVTQKFPLTTQSGIANCND